ASIDSPGSIAIEEPVGAAPNTSGPARPAATRIAHAILDKTIIHGRIDGPLLLAHRTRPAFARRRPSRLLLGGRLRGGFFRWVQLPLHLALTEFARSGRFSSNRTFHPFGVNIWDLSLTDPMCRPYPRPGVAQPDRSVEY